MDWRSFDCDRFDLADVGEMATAGEVARRYRDREGKLSLLFPHNHLDLDQPPSLFPFLSVASLSRLNRTGWTKGVTPLRIYKWIVILVIIALLVTMVLPFLTAGAEGKKGGTIRVALYLDTSSLHQTTDTVTLRAEKGFLLTDEAGKLYATHPAGEEVRVSPYQFRLLIKETGNLGEALNLVQRVEQAGIPTRLMTVSRKGGEIYRIEAGEAATLSAAQTLLTQLKGATGLPGEILGPYIWEAGLFSSEEEATSRLHAIQNAGFDAHLALLPDDGKSGRYLVLAGNEATEGELASYYQELTTTLPDVRLQPLAHTAYLIQEKDPLLEGDGNQWIVHYYYPSGMKLIATPNGGTPPAITVEEKGNTYRGMLEFSIFNGHLALVNQLPVDEYLYGVVGAEMSTGWPIEALKAQAVIARTYALSKGNRWGIANVVDNTLDQAYYGIKREGEDIRQAVDETSGQILTYNGKMIEALYSSNMGGMTADGSEVWGNPLPYLRPVESPDTIPLEKTAKWYRIARENGEIGFVHSDYITLTQEQNPIGLPYGVVNTDALNFRSGPGTTHDLIGRLTNGEYVTIIETVAQDNAYQWIGGPVDGLTLMNALNSKLSSTQPLPFTQPIRTLQVTAKGPSGRVTQMAADGLVIPVKYPDSYRSMFRSVFDSAYDSTKFEVEEMDRYTVLGAGGRKVEYPEESPLAVIGAGGKVGTPNGGADQFLLYNKEKKIRVVSSTPMFRFLGNGYGHGLGLSQYGAKAMAENGNDYIQILKHYYTDQVQLETIP